MEKAKQFLSVSDEASEVVARLAVPPRRAGDYPSFYENFSLRGLRVDRVEPGLVVCSFRDRNGNLAQGAIANMVDEIGYAVIHVEGIPISVSVNMSISYLSTAKVNDELEITSKVLGQKGGYFATIILMRNKATGEIIAEGRHSLFNAHASKM
ncbi:acyl-coenzyme A thioesterase 13 isoform X2 [Rhodamnia argentea]|uniref:Acyl-coenzyme A thioesterase 13 isoform X2 n=1 Tax=Rhodamnia argentea TaxID=178133 RepID=A0ABM3HTY0_9MYRT|nr:acyl-coenzyme A thioesterase 13 isoform X2 [Rhodamnia argentea]